LGGGIYLKKILVLHLVLLLILVGCVSEETKGPTQLKDYDLTSLKTKLKSVPFQPKLPTKLPMSVNQTTVDIHDNDINITFDGPGKDKHGDHIILDIIKSYDMPFSTGNTIKVNIGKTKGTYEEQLGRGRFLFWKDDGINYRIRYYWNKSFTVFTKAELIAMAESFK
jgi:hypothetical protein